MGRFQRYMVWQIAGTLLGVTLALSAVALLTQSLGALDLIVDQHQNADVFLKVTLLALPQLAALILPIAVFAGVLIALNRLLNEQELVAAQAAGLSRWQAVAPALRLGVVAALAIFIINAWVQPTSYRTMRTILFAAKTDLATALVRPGEFSHPSKGLTVYVRTTTRDGTLKNVFLHDESKVDAAPVTYLAEEGRMVTRDNGPALVMRQGSRQTLKETGEFGFLSFDEYVFDLAPFLNTQDKLFYKLSDRYLHELFYPDTTQLWESRNVNKLLSEGHYRLSSPLYAPAFALLAAVAILGGGFNRMGYGRRIFWTSMTAIFVRVLGFAAQSTSVGAPDLNILQYGVPVLTGVIALIVLLREPPQVRDAIRRIRSRRMIGESA